MNVSPSRTRMITAPSRPKVSFHYQNSPNLINNNTQSKTINYSPIPPKIISDK